MLHQVCELYFNDPLNLNLEYFIFLNYFSGVYRGAQFVNYLISFVGEFASAIETLVTAISLIRQSKVSHDDRCKILISSLQVSQLN